MLSSQKSSNKESTLIFILTLLENTISSSAKRHLKKYALR